MPHSFNEVGFHEKLFVIRHLCHGSKSLCSVHEDDIGEDWRDYRQWMKGMISDELLAVAIKFRNLHDVLTAQLKRTELAKRDNEARKGLTIGVWHGAQSVLTVREACNKIIHATDAYLDWRPVSEDAGAHDYWTGTMWLGGVKNSQEWKIEVHVDELCIALSRIVESVEDVTSVTLYDHDE